MSTTATTVSECQAQLDVLIAYYAKPKEKPPRETTPVWQIDDRALLDKAMAAGNGAGSAFTALWGGDCGGYASASEADLALLCRLAWWTGEDTVRMDQLFRQSGLYREKWERAAYCDETIAKAIEHNGGKGYTGGEVVSEERKSADLGQPPSTHYDCSDDGNAQRLIRRHGDRIRYLPGEEKWLIWDGQRWKRDDAHQIENLAAETLRTIHHEAGDCPDEKRRKELGKWAITSGGAQRRTGALLCARSEPVVVVRKDDLDRDPYLLNVLNGTLDLRTGKLRPHRQQDALTWLAPVNFQGLSARDAIFEKVLHDATGGDLEFQRWLQRYAGMSLVGEMTELVLVLLGGTETGKSTLTGALTATLGEGNYAMTGNQDALLRNANNVGGPRGSVMAFEGRRLVTIPEFDPTKTLDEPLLKTLTGEKVFQGRALWENDHAFQPISKLWLHTNHMPKVSIDDSSLWRRLRVAPFVCRPAKIDETIKPYLTDPAQAGPAILAWALQGCLDWQRDGGGKNGLGKCGVVDRATAALRIKMDPLADFFDECCAFGPESFSVTAEIRSGYGAWADLNNVSRNQRKGDKARAAGLRLRGASDAGPDGFGIVDGKKVRGWTGVRLLDLRQGSLL